METSNISEASKPEIFHEVNVHCMKTDKAIYLKYFCSAKERLELISKLGDQAYMVYEYLLRMASLKDKPVITDKGIADYFGWNTSKAKRYRLLLEREGWFNSYKYTMGKKRKGVSFYIGLEAVTYSKVGI
jgi:hypothetical protein